MEDEEGGTDRRPDDREAWRIVLGVGRGGEAGGEMLS